MKKIIALLLALVMVLALAACAKQETPAEQPAQDTPATETPAEEKPAETPAEETPAEEAPADPMAELIAAAQAEGELVVYGSCEEEYLAAACENFEKLYGIKTLRSCSEERKPRCARSASCTRRWKR